MTGPESIVPPDETGTDVLRRFRYQAHAAFQFCLSCALERDVKAVIPEHFEDVAVKYESSWRLIQIKTRDAELGPWLLSHLLGDSGAMHSLWRSHKALKDGGNTESVFYEARLEGSLRRDNAIEEFVPNRTGPHEKTRIDCAEKLGAGRAECDEFLDRFSVTPSQPSRESIVASNLRNLGALAPHLTYEQSSALYDEVIQTLDSAMHAELLGGAWKPILPDSAEPDDQTPPYSAGKLIDASHLVDLAAALTNAPAVAIERFADPDALRASALEKKLRTAGASDQVVLDALSLRANASRREEEIRAADQSGHSASLSDLRERIRVSAQALAANITTDGMQANQIYDGVMERFHERADQLDQSNVFHRDPMLLVGKLCDISDECDFAWGRADG